MGYIFFPSCVFQVLHLRLLSDIIGMFSNCLFTCALTCTFVYHGVTPAYLHIKFLNSISGKTRFKIRSTELTNLIRIQCGVTRLSSGSYSLKSLDTIQRCSIQTIVFITGFALFRVCQRRKCWWEPTLAVNKSSNQFKG